MIRLSQRIEDAAFAEANQHTANISESRALRTTFREHLKMVARALHAIEMNDDGFGNGQEDELIEKALE